MWSEGDAFLARYEGMDGVVRGAHPLRVVGERNGYLATWLPGGTHVAKPIFADGRALRDAPIEDRWSFPRIASVQPWDGAGILMLFPRAAAHSVWVFPHGWYVNLERQHTWDERGVVTRDHVLDLWCEEPRVWSWKDEDELEHAVRFGVLSTEDAAEIRAEGERVGTMIERWEPPFSDGWEDWRPHPSWPIPELPEEWDVV